MIKAIAKTLLIVVGFALLLVAVMAVRYGMISRNNMALLGQPAQELFDDGFRYRDLNKNARLDPYEDSRRSPEVRVDDLLAQMTVAEKAGTMFITQIASHNGGELVERPISSDPLSLVLPGNSTLIAQKLMNHFNVVFTDTPQAMALWHNKIQTLAERTRLGIPITLASDPRHGSGSNPAASLPAGHFSLWPEPLGFAATRNPELVRQFGRFANEEYRSVGIRLALHPMADLATEPRWARAAGTFGEDAHLSAQMVKAYVAGFQGDTLNAGSVATMVKHFTGGGPQAGGRDAHFPHGKEQIYPGGQFDYHLIPFVEGAFPAGVAQIMPYYGIPVDQTSEAVGFAFNREIITGMLRDRYGFEGVVCSDWGLVTDTKLLGLMMFKEASAWGVEHLTIEDRLLKLLDAGNDQIGGEYLPEILVDLVQRNLLSEQRLDVSVRRILLDKFRLGLFDNPYVEAEKSSSVVGNEAARRAGEVAQRRSIILLKNGQQEFDTLRLPVDFKSGQRQRVYLENVDPELVGRFADVVERPAEADFAVIRLAAPFYPRSGLMESNFHSGDLDFKGAEKERLIKLMQTLPTIVDIYLDRAAVIPEIAANSAVLIANFGATDQVIVDLIAGAFTPSGRLPIELPRSMIAVEAQLEDVPYDSDNPLFPFGYGRNFAGELPAAGPLP